MLMIEHHHASVPIHSDRRGDQMNKRFSDGKMQSFVRDMARGRPGATSERVAGGFLWYPKINGERIPQLGSFPTHTAARDAARDFKEECRVKLGEVE
jgi:hypothetical protein